MWVPTAHEDKGAGATQAPEQQLAIQSLAIRLGSKCDVVQAAAGRTDDEQTIPIGSKWFRHVLGNQPPVS